MYTFQDGYEELQANTNDRTTSRLVRFKRDLNQGGALAANKIGRRWTQRYITTDLTATKQYYQLPSKAIRITELKIIIGTDTYKPDMVSSEEEWDKINATPVSGQYPLYYFLKGNNEIGVHPIPSTTAANGFKVSYESQNYLLTAADFSTGTITTINGGTSIVNASAVFLPQMVGRQFEVTDGTDGYSYKIADYVSATQLTLENAYEGIGGGGRTYRIGEVFNLPQGYEDIPNSWAMQKYAFAVGDQKKQLAAEKMWKDQIKDLKKTFAKTTSRRGVKTKATSGRRLSWIDLTPPINYP